MKKKHWFSLTKLNELLNNIWLKFKKITTRKNEYIKRIKT